MSEEYCKPYTASQIEAIKQKFRELPTYKNEEYEGGYILPPDMPGIAEAMGMERSAEQFEQYKLYWDRNFGGKVPMGQVVGIIENLHDTVATTLFTASVYDKDGNGFIDAEEFEEHQRIMATHDPRLKLASYNDFVKAADANKDGKVSLEEFKNWINACLQN